MSVLTRPPGGDAPPEEAVGESRREPGPATDAGLLPRLHLPHGLASWRFAVIVGALLAAGMVALLTVNTSLAAGSITLSRLESELARKTEQQQSLEVAVESLASPFALQQAAAALGMVPSTTPAFLDPATGRLSGALEPAAAQAAPSPPAPQVTVPEPEPAPAPSRVPTGRPDREPLAPPLPAAPDGVQTTPTPEPLPGPPPRGDGARLPVPDEASATGAAPDGAAGTDAAAGAAPAGAGPAPSPTPTPSGDGAAVLPRGED